MSASGDFELSTQIQNTFTHNVKRRLYMTTWIIVRSCWCAASYFSTAYRWSFYDFTLLKILPDKDHITVCLPETPWETYRLTCHSYCDESGYRFQKSGVNIQAGNLTSRSQWPLWYCTSCRYSQHTIATNLEVWTFPLLVTFKRMDKKGVILVNVSRFRDVFHFSDDSFLDRHFIIDIRASISV